MNIFKRTEKLGKNMKLLDFSLLKGSILFFTLFILSAFPNLATWLLSINWYWYLILGVAFAFPLWKKMLSY